MNLRLVVVDDDPGLRAAVVEAVRSTADMQLVGEAQTLADGWRLVNQQRPDVLLVDLGLPDGNGIDLIRRTAAALPDCDVVVLTVFGDERHVLASLEAGATGYLLKDTPTAAIVEQVRVLREGGSPISPVIARRLLLRFSAWAAQRPVARGADAADATLSPREREVLQLCAKGYRYEEIGPMLGVSRHTVTGFVKRTYRKLQVHSKTEAVYEARRLGLLDD